MLWVGQPELSMLQGASVVSCFGWARLHPAPRFLFWRYMRLNWSCRVLVWCPHKRSRRGFLPHLQPVGSAQIDTSYPGVPGKKTQRDKSAWVRSLDGSLESHLVWRADPKWLPFPKRAKQRAGSPLAVRAAMLCSPKERAAGPAVAKPSNKACLFWVNNPVLKRTLVSEDISQSTP